MKRLLFCLTMIPAATALADHNALLPRPQQVQYGSGTLALQGLSVRFASPPSTEDRFAAEQLASGLSAIGQTKVEVKKGKSSRKSILLNRTGEAGALPADMESPGPDSRESYTLQVTPKGAEIRARSSAGIFYGVQTLLQMVEGTGAEAVLPVAEVKDWPALAYRGVMIDFSEGELIRVSEAERQIDLMARFKINQYYFYSEASIEFEGYEVVNPNGRYTREEVRHVIEYARQRHIDVVPCMELYGHMHNLFRYEKYADLGLPRYGGEFDPRNPRMYAVLDDWIEQTAKLFPSPWYHVGFDEPWSLGKIGVVPGKDPFKTFMDVLRHISEKAKSHGKRIGFFADIEQGASTLSKHPELLEDVPAGAIAYPWIYEVRTNYAPFVEPLAKRGIPTVVTPGVWGWNELFPGLPPLVLQPQRADGDGQEVRHPGHTQHDLDGQPANHLPAGLSGNRVWRGGIVAIGAGGHQLVLPRLLRHRLSRGGRRRHRRGPGGIIHRGRDLRERPARQYLGPLLGRPAGAGPSQEAASRRAGSAPGAPAGRERAGAHPARDAEVFRPDAQEPAGGGAPVRLPGHEEPLRPGVGRVFPPAAGESEEGAGPALLRQPDELTRPMGCWPTCGR